MNEKKKDENKLKILIFIPRKSRLKTDLLWKGFNGVQK